MIIEESIHIDAPADAVFALYSDVASWSRWDPDTSEARLDGPFEAGTPGRIVPTKGRGAPMRVTEVTPNRSFTVVAWIPLFRMQFDHELTPTATGVRALHRVRFSGPLSFLFGPIVGRQVRAGLPHTMRSLKAHAERSGAAAVRPVPS